MTVRSLVLMSSVTAILAVAAAEVRAEAADERAGGLEEIVVTAQKRSESLQDTPISVSAVTSQILEDRQILTVEGLQHLVPNLYMEQALTGTTTPKMFLRGVGVDNQVFSFDSPIGLYVDGVYIARVTGALVDLVDVERVEFLRGPQGTLYGRNSSVGAMHIIHREPSLSGTRAEASLAIGTRDQTNAQFAISSPLVEDKLGLSISGSMRRRDGFMRDLTNGETAADEDVISGRVALLYQPSDALRFTVRGDLMLDNSRPTVGSNYLVNDDNDLYTYESSPGSKLINKVEPRGLSATINWAQGAFDLTSITAYRELEYHNAGDVDGRADVRSFEVDRQELHQDQLTQEVYLSSDHMGSLPLSWTAGAFFLEEDNEFHWALRIFAAPPTQVFDQKTKSAAAYTQVSYPVTEKLNLTAGVRYTYESKEMDAVQYLPTDTVPTQELELNPDFQFHDKMDTRRTNWRAAIDYHVSEPVMLYANAGTGFRSGGFNGSARDVAGIVSGSFGPETTFMAEAGVKADMFDQRLRTNVLYYYAEYEDLQQSIVNPDGSIVAGNVQAKTSGFEAEVTAVPVDGLQLTASIGTLQQDIKDSPWKLKDSPKLQYRVGLNYDLPLGTGGTFRIGGDVSYSDEYFNDTNNAPGTEVEPYYMTNAFLSYVTPGEHWSFTLAGYNLGDEDYPNHTFNIANGFISSVQFPITPRRWLLTAQYRL